MKIPTVLLLTALSSFMVSPPLEARTWTASDGKTMEADYVSATAKVVTIRRIKDRRTFAVPLAHLSAADRDFVERKLAEALPSTEPISAAGSPLGKYKSMFRNGWAKGKHGDLQYQLYAPKRASSKKPLPVVVYLHGSLECGNDNVKQIKTAPAKSFVRFFKKRPCILVVPQAPVGNSWMGTTGDAVISLIEDILKEVSAADPKRVYLTGYSLGGLGTWHLLGKRPDLFAAAIPAAGAGNPAVAAKLKGVDVWIFHGTKDASVPVKRGREMAEAMKKAGAPVKFTEMKSADHSIPGKVFFREETHEWLFAQKRD